MPTTVQAVYDQVSKIFFEDNGFTGGTGVMTDDMFFMALNDVMNDFLDRTGPTKKIINIPLQINVSTYVEPDVITEVQAASVSETFIYRDSGFYLSSVSPEWTQDSGQPAKWREDENPPRRIQLTPIPNIDGWTVTVSGSGYGTLSATSTVVDFDIVASNSGYGTISSAPTGPVYVETLNQGYGVLSSMVSSTGNITMFSAVSTSRTETYLLDYLENLEDSFVPFVVYGVVAKLFSADSEAKDNQRALYAQQRWEDGLQLVSSICDETSFEQGEKP